MGGGRTPPPRAKPEEVPVKPFSFYRSLLCLSLIPGTFLLAVAPPTGPSGAEVGRLIEQLGDDDFGVRQAATQRLKAAGDPALDALYKALSSDDLEVRHRAARIVAAIEGRLYPELQLAGHSGRVLSVCV